MAATPIDLAERQYISAFGNAIIGITVHKAGVLTDVDDAVGVVIVNEGSEEVFNALAHHASVGTYDVAVTPPLTATPGLYLVYWDYEIEGQAYTEESYIEVGRRSPTYDSLPQDFQEVIEQVWIRFADLFDSPLGGPHLQTYMQTNFGRERMAQLMRTSLARLNVISQPHTTYAIHETDGKVFPIGRWGGLLEQMTYIEVLKHLQRSYVEQPEVVGVNLARFDRRDYMNRWGEILRGEQEDLAQMIDSFKISNMGLGASSVLVSGGVYGRYGPTRHIGLLAMRPNYIPRYY